ncbi:MAG: DUF3800 domain-containing protein [Pyrinomonadaceae bacterium]|jgi:hypothetical protein|nr:DUF3800 domain-containing protein [Pyrinomonadaceae bacterium]
MHLIYLDEAGNSGTNLDDPHQPIHTVCGVIVKDSQWLPIETQIDALIAHLVPRVADREGFEFHNSDIFQGHGFFKGWPWPTRVDALERLLDIIVTNKLPIVWGAVDKQKHKAKYVYPAAPHDMAFLLCAERAERWFKNHAKDDVGMFIADDTKAKSDMKKSFKEYRKTIALGNRKECLEHIIDTIHFADSRETFGISFRMRLTISSSGILWAPLELSPFLSELNGMYMQEGCFRKKGAAK